MTLYQAHEHRRSRIPGLVDQLSVARSPHAVPNLLAWYQANLEIGYSHGNSIYVFKDWSGNGFHLSGTGQYIVDSGIALIDSDDMANTASPAIGNNPFSICVFGDTYNSDGTLFGVGGGMAAKNSLNVCVDHLYCWEYDPAFTSMGTSAPWYLITVTYDQSSIRIYKDSSLFVTLTQGSYNIQSGIYMFRWFYNDRQSTLRARFAAVYTKTLSSDEVGFLSEYAHGLPN